MGTPVASGFDKKTEFIELHFYFGMIISNLFSSPLVSACKTHKPRGTQGANLSLYIWTNTKDLLSSVQHCYMLIILFEKTS